MRSTRTCLTLAAVGWLALASFPMLSPLSAQTVNDSRWLPWLGCWQLVADVIQPSSLGDRPGDSEPRVPEERLVCVVPASEGAAEIKTYAEGELLLQETLFADGVRRPVELSGCRGHQLTQWSRDGARLFFRSEMTCENQSHRSFSGVSFMRAWETWVDIQALASGAEREVVIRRYRPASPGAAAKLGFESPSAHEATAMSTARAAISQPLNIDDFIEASEIVESEALEAALMENGTGLELNSNTLIRLADAGVSPNTIDLMLALAYPERFEVSRETSGSGYGGDESGGGYGYEYWNTFYFAPFGYYYWYTPYRSFFVYRPVVPDEGVSGGRLVKGRGYTRVGPSRTANSADGVSGKRRGSRTDSSSSGSSDGSSDSSGGSAGSGGYSRGDSSSSRTAKPREP
ncbi:MAG TPA: hypothetical protein VGC53_06510 [Vicinamibacteria bacterium]